MAGIEPASAGIPVLWDIYRMNQSVWTSLLLFH